MLDLQPASRCSGLPQAAVLRLACRARRDDARLVCLAGIRHIAAYPLSFPQAEVPRIPEDEMMYVQQMLAQVQKAQEAARARQVAAAGEPEEQAQPAVQIDEWILQVGVGWDVRLHDWAQVDTGFGSGAHCGKLLQQSLLQCCSFLHPCSLRRSTAVRQHLHPPNHPLTLLCLRFPCHPQFVELLKEHCGIDPDKPLECQEVRLSWAGCQWLLLWCCLRRCSAA